MQFQSSKLPWDINRNHQWINFSSWLPLAIEFFCLSQWYYINPTHPCNTAIYCSNFLISFVHIWLLYILTSLWTKNDNLQRNLLNFPRPKLFNFFLVVSVFNSPVRPCEFKRPTFFRRNYDFNTRWWFQIFFSFHPYLGKIPILTNIFGMGWNHQPVLICFNIISLLRDYEGTNRWLITNETSHFVAGKRGIGWVYVCVGGPLAFSWNHRTANPHKKKHQVVECSTSAASGECQVC